MQEMHKENYTYATKDLHHQLRKPTTHTKLTKHRLLERRQKGLDTTGKREKSTKLTSSP
jgi:hypothetical protein